MKQRMSNKEEVESTAQRLLNRCSQIEESNKKIEQSIVENGNEVSDDMSSAEYRQQLDEIRRMLVTTQENAKLKQKKLEEEILLLKNELNTLKKERESKIVAEKKLIKERDEFKKKLVSAMSWAEKAHNNVVQVNEENTKYKKIVFALGQGGEGTSARNLRSVSSRILMGDSTRNLAGNSTRNLGGNSTRNLGGNSTRNLGGNSMRFLGGNSTRNLTGNSTRNFTIEEGKFIGASSSVPLRGLSRSLNESTRAGESPMEINSRRNSEGSTRSLLRDWGASLMSNRKLMDPSTDERNKNIGLADINENIALANSDDDDDE